MNVRIAVCDDQEIYRDDIIRNCKKLLDGQNVIYECFASGEELLAADVKSDFLFLDIEMTGIDGIDVKELLEQKNARTKIIFLTSHEERMIEAFGANVIGFLRKPLQIEALEPIVQRMKLLSSKRTVEWEDGGKHYVVYAEAIRYIEAQDKYTRVVTEDAGYLVRRTVREWEALLPKPDFCRINRSCMVHLRIFDKAQNEIMLEEDKTIRLSRKNKDAIVEQYKEYIRKKAEEL